MRPNTGRSVANSAFRPGRAVDRQRPLARAQVERLEHPDQPEPVVEVVVRDEDRVELGQPDRAQQLLLGALAAVEQDPVAARAQQDRGQPAARGRHRAGGAGEEEREVHGRPDPRRASVERDQLERDAAVARPSRCPIVWRGARRRSVGEPGLKIAKPSPRPRAAAGASARRRPRRRPGSGGASAPAGPPAGPASWIIAIRAPPASTIRTSGSRACSSAESTLPRTACTGGPSACELLEHRAAP